MKQFLKYTSILIIGLLISMVLLDMAYTSIYNSGAYRNKVMWIRDMKPDTLDYAIFGSSRARYTVNPTHIEEATGKKGVNLGMNAAGPFEVHLAVREFFKHTYAKQIYIQVDYTYFTAAPDQVGQVNWLPYIKEKDIYEQFERYGNSYFYLKNIPMYRYLQFDGALGFRNVAVSLLGKPPDFLVNAGFNSREGVLEEDTPYPYTLEKTKNKEIEKIIGLAKQKQVALFFFTAPIYKPKENFSILAAHLPNYTNMSTTITHKNYFSDHMHVNKAGAALFTQQFIETFFSNVNKYW